MGDEFITVDNNSVAAADSSSEEGGEARDEAVEGGDATVDEEVEGGDKAAAAAVSTSVEIELPKSLRHGLFICPPAKVEDGLRR